MMVFEKDQSLTIVRLYAQILFQDQFSTRPVLLVLPLLELRYLTA